MGDRPEGERGGRGRGFGRGGRGGGRGGKPDGGPRKGGFGRKEDGEWRPVTKLGRLVKSGKVASIEDIFRWAIPIKEHDIVDHFLKETLKEEVMQVKPVQKQTQAGQRTRFKAYVAVGDSNGHIGLGWKSSKEVQGAIKGAIANAKLNLRPVRRGYWGNKIGNAHTIPTKVTGKGGSVRVRLVPAPRGSNIVAAPTSKKVLQLAGVGDVYTCSSGKTRTKGNFVKATFDALTKTYTYLTPDFWGRPKFEDHIYEVNSKYLHQVANVPHH